ncbi:acyl-CoA-binding protein, partial [Mortierella sp. GBAus27b]
LYGAYKQGNMGDVQSTKPAFYDIAARSRWQAWSNMSGKSKEEAQAIYVDIV